MDVIKGSFKTYLKDVNLTLIYVRFYVKKGFDILTYCG